MAVAAMKTYARCRLDADAAAASRLVAAALIALACSTVPGAADPPFYAGKQITLIAGSGVGGGYDLLARLAARHLGRLIPGHPTIVVQNMPAAGSLVATNQIYNSAPKDGTVIALIQRGMLLAKLSNPSGVRFELEKLNWLGNLNSETGLVLTWHTAPHRRAQDLFEQELIVGGQTGVDPEITPRLYNALIGTKFKIVTGYNGTTEIALAMERGEVQGIGDWSWSSFKVQRPDWLPQKKVHLLLQGALTRDPELPDLPNALDFVKGDTERKDKAFPDKPKPSSEGSGGGAGAPASPTPGGPPALSPDTLKVGSAGDITLTAAGITEHSTVLIDGLLHGSKFQEPGKLTFRLTAEETDSARDMSIAVSLDGAKEHASPPAVLHIKA